MEKKYDPNYGPVSQKTVHAFFDAITKCDNNGKPELVKQLRAWLDTIEEKGVYIGDHNQI
jgi:hypothetical protein